jgi:hypothetical protein
VRARSVALLTRAARSTTPTTKAWKLSEDTVEKKSLGPTSVKTPQKLLQERDGGALAGTPDDRGSLVGDRSWAGRAAANRPKAAQWMSNCCVRGHQWPKGFKKREEGSARLPGQYPLRRRARSGKPAINPADSGAEAPTTDGGGGARRPPNTNAAPLGRAATRGGRGGGGGLPRTPRSPKRKESERWLKPLLYTFDSRCLLAALWGGGAKPKSRTPTSGWPSKRHCPLRVSDVFSNLAFPNPRCKASTTTPCAAWRTAATPAPATWIWTAWPMIWGAPKPPTLVEYHLHAGRSWRSSRGRHLALQGRAPPMKLGGSTTRPPDFLALAWQQPPACGLWSHSHLLCVANFPDPIPAATSPTPSPAGPDGPPPFPLQPGTPTPGPGCPARSHVWRFSAVFDQADGRRRATSGVFSADFCGPLFLGGLSASFWRSFGELLAVSGFRAEARGFSGGAWRNVGGLRNLQESRTARAPEVRRSPFFLAVSVFGGVLADFWRSVGGFWRTFGGLRFWRTFGGLLAASAVFDQAGALPERSPTPARLAARRPRPAVGALRRRPRAEPCSGPRALRPPRPAQHPLHYSAPAGPPPRRGRIAR